MGELDNARSRLPNSLVSKLDNLGNFVGVGAGLGAIVSLLSPGIIICANAEFLKLFAERSAGYLFGTLCVVTLLGGYVGAKIGNKTADMRIRKLAVEHEVYASEIKRYYGKLIRSGKYYDSDD